MKRRDSRLWFVPRTPKGKKIFLFVLINVVLASILLNLLK
jgi:hypothetical protein